MGIDFTKKAKILDVTAKWEIVGGDKEQETRGYSPDKVWFQLKSDPSKTALFKPDSHINNSDCELEAYKVATALSIPCAKAEVAEYKSQKGVLSHNFKQPDKIYVPAEQYIFESIPDMFRAFQKYDPSKEFYHWVSMDLIQSYAPEIEKPTVDMLVFDCLIQNRDRHGKNFEMEIDLNTQTVKRAPLFDHGMCLGWSDELKEFNKSDYTPVEYKAIQDEIISEETMDECRMTWTKNKPVSHIEMLGNLSAEYPKQVGNLLEKAKRASLPAFCKDRLDTMLAIHEKCKGLKPDSNREKQLAENKPVQPIDLSRYEALETTTPQVSDDCQYN